MACQAGDNPFDFDSMVLYSTGATEETLTCKGGMRYEYDRRRTIPI